MAYKFNPFLDDFDYYEAAGAASNGLPVGGTANQKLTKIDATDFNAQWVDDVGGGGHTIQEEGTPMTSRTNLNFVGSNVTVTDDLANDATKVSIFGNIEGGSASSIYMTSQVINGGTA